MKHSFKVGDIVYCIKPSVVPSWMKPPHRGPWKIYSVDPRTDDNPYEILAKKIPSAEGWPFTSDELTHAEDISETEKILWGLE